MRQNEVQIPPTRPKTPVTPGAERSGERLPERGNASARRSGPVSVQVLRATADKADTLPTIEAPATPSPKADVLYEAPQTETAREQEKAEDGKPGMPNPGKQTALQRETAPDETRKTLQIVEENAHASEPATLLLIDPQDAATSLGAAAEDDATRSQVARKGRAGAAALGARAGGLQDEEEMVVLPESGDRLHRIAVVAHLLLQELRAPKLKKSGALPPLRAKTRAECERRCGTDGFCDPSSPRGCGGLHCGHLHDMLY